MASVRLKMRTRITAIIFLAAISAFSSTNAVYLSSREFTSVWATEEDNAHTKMVEITSDGKVHLDYAVAKYDASTGGSHWETNSYWTWEKDLPDWVRKNLKKK